MKIRYLIILFGLLCILNACDKIENNTNDYTQYHSEIIAAETLISLEKYEKALIRYEKLFQKEEGK